MPRRRFEGAQWIERGQTAGNHGSPLAFNRDKVM
jgi:hypothetical protein